MGGFLTALIFVFRVVEPPYNVHAGILGLMVNLPVLMLVSRLFPGIRKKAGVAKE